MSRYRHPSSDLATLPQITAAGLAALKPEVRDFLESGAGQERTLARNTAAFDDWRFRPRLMRGLGEPSLATRFMGVELDLPLLVGPLGADRLFHPDGQKAIARAAAKAGIASMAPEAGSFSLEALRATAPAAVRFGQLHPTGTEADYRRMLGRFEDAGFDAIVVTCDCPTAGWRERNRRNGFTPPQDVVGGNYPGDTETFHELFATTGTGWDWLALGRAMRHTSLPWLAKGIMTEQDARAAVDAGATAIGVSNHGGRQLDDLPAALDALPGIADAIGEHAEISFDGGVRRGTDVIKALALGADVVILGRLAVHGLAAAGEAGVHAVLTLLQDEIRTTLTLLGHGGVADLDDQAVQRR